MTDQVNDDSRPSINVESLLNDDLTGEVPSSSIDVPSSLDLPDTGPTTDLPSDLFSQTQPDGCIETLRQLCRAVQTECAFPELLPSWTLSYVLPEDEQAVQKLMTAWSATQESEEDTKISLNAVDRLASKINEAAANRLTRCMQVYYLTRLRKILHDPVSVVGLQEANADTNLVEERELAIARDWENYITDHELDFTAATFSCVHIMAKPELVNEKSGQPFGTAYDILKKYAAYAVPEEERSSDEMLEVIIEALNNSAGEADPILCMMCDRFRHGFYSCKLDARL